MLDYLIETLLRQLGLNTLQMSGDFPESDWVAVDI
jgi:hypothetical protein